MGKLFLLFPIVGLRTATVVSTFGSFIRLYVQSQNDINEPSTRPNAFLVRLQAQRDMASLTRPKKITERTKKDKLFNDLIDVIETEGCMEAL